jgi:PKD repeat protein
LESKIKKHSTAIASIASLILLVTLVSSASATTSPISISQKILYPHASFTMSPSTYCTGSGYYEPWEKIQFTDTSTSIYSIKSWNWDFGDGYSSSLKNPIHSFNDGWDTDYTITLKVTNTLGKTSIATKSIHIVMPPQ